MEIFFLDLSVKHIADSKYLGPLSEKLVSMHVFRIVKESILIILQVELGILLQSLWLIVLHLY